MPTGQCAGMQQFCTAGAGVLCGWTVAAPPRPPSPPPETALGSPPPPQPTASTLPPPLSTLSPPPGTPPCVANSSLPECGAYQYPDASIAADLDSLCSSMSYMPGCSIRSACKVGSGAGP